MEKGSILNKMVLGLNTGYHVYLGKLTYFVSLICTAEVIAPTRTELWVEDYRIIDMTLAHNV